MFLFDRLRARLRSLRYGQIPRQIPPRGPKPRIGAAVVHADQSIRLLVQAGMSDDLWKWLMDHGWRVEPHRPDRREYRDIPVSYVIRLIDADPTCWKQLMTEAISNTQQRSAWTRGQR
jgi:hypothetical protein